MGGELDRPPLDSSLANLEHTLGHLCNVGLIDAEEAMSVLGTYEAWVAMGEPKFSLSIMNPQPGQVGGAVARPTMTQ